MARYLKSIMKIMPVVQARQLTQLLDDLRATGEVRDAEEYENALRKLSKLVNAENPVPSFRQIKALVWQLCSSDAHNVMMQATKNDIEAVFVQTDEVGRRLDDQHFLMMKSVLSELEHAVAEQEAEVRRLQLVGSPNTEFRNVLLNSFAATTLHQINRSEAGSDLLFFNNRTGHPVGEVDIPNAYVSENGKKLVLPTTNEPRILPISASLLSDSDTYGTELETAVNNKISNVIDGTRGTYWSRTVYLSEVVPRVSTKIQFDFGVGRDVNYAIIQGASHTPFFVTEMWGVSPDGHKINLMLRRASTSIDAGESILENPLEEEIEVDGSVRIDFEQVFVKAVQIKFSYSSYEEGDFWVDNKINAHKIYDADETLKPEDFAPFIKETLLSEDLVTKLNIPENVSQHINGNVYFFGLDNVWFGNGLYTDSGIFVSEPIRIENPGVVSVQTKERNVGELRTGTDEELAAGNYSSVKNAGSVEYELIVKRLIEGAQQLEHLPVPFLGQTRVIRERLIFTKRINDSVLLDAGPLRFCPRITALSDIQIYRNDTLLQIGNSPGRYMVAFRKDGTDSTLLDWTDAPAPDIYNIRLWDLPHQRLWILINSPSPSDVYTMSYNIRTSSRSSTDIGLSLGETDAVIYMDDQKTIYMGDDGRLIFQPDLVSDITKTSELYLQVSLRRNTAEKAVSPEVDEFALLVAPYE